MGEPLLLDPRAFVPHPFHGCLTSMPRRAVALAVVARQREPAKCRSYADILVKRKSMQRGGKVGRCAPHSSLHFALCPVASRTHTKPQLLELPQLVRSEAAVSKSSSWPRPSFPSASGDRLSMSASATRRTPLFLGPRSRIIGDSGHLTRSDRPSLTIEAGSIPCSRCSRAWIDRRRSSHRCEEEGGRVGIRSA